MTWILDRKPEEEGEHPVIVQVDDNIIQCYGYFVSKRGSWDVFTGLGPGKVKVLMWFDVPPPPIELTRS